ncbi:MAG: hypothetical protein V4660_04145 [Pseudomonadota bacterium]
MRKPFLPSPGEICADYRGITINLLYRYVTTPERLQAELSNRGNTTQTVFLLYQSDRRAELTADQLQGHPYAKHYQRRNECG